LEGIGKPRDALDVLYDFLVVRKTTRVWQKSYQDVTIKFLELCVDQQAVKEAKDGLFTYKSLTQQVRDGRVVSLARRPRCGCPTSVPLHSVQSLGGVCVRVRALQTELDSLAFVIQHLVETTVARVQAVVTAFRSGTAVATATKIDEDLVRTHVLPVAVGVDEPQDFKERELLLPWFRFAAEMLRCVTCVSTPPS
jgi:hypothetical protein